MGWSKLVEENKNLTLYEIPRVISIMHSKFQSGIHNSNPNEISDEKNFLHPLVELTVDIQMNFIEFLNFVLNIT